MEKEQNEVGKVKINNEVIAPRVSAWGMFFNRL